MIVEAATTNKKLNVALIRDLKTPRLPRPDPGIDSRRAPSDPPALIAALATHALFPVTPAKLLNKLHITQFFSPYGSFFLL